MIKHRDSNAHLHSAEILKKITDYDIFKYYCSNFKSTEKKFCSDLREDKSPSVSIAQWKGRLWYKDFGHPEHSFDCFSYICAKYGCSFIEALYLIDNDFQLNLSSFKPTGMYSMGVKATSYTVQPVIKDTVKLKVRFRKWSTKDKIFWSKFGINKKTLLKFAVCPIDYYWINYHRFDCSLSYVFQIKGRYKIYSPNDEIKWISNTCMGNVQGWVQLPKSGDIVVLTSSLKDVMCLFELGFSAIALQSEMQMPKEGLISALQKRFKDVVVFYDNDFTNVDNPGQTMAKKICNKFSLKNICIPSEFGVKDISDYISKYKSLKDAKHLVANSYYNARTEEEIKQQKS
jgi:hypothetical protein